MQLSKDLLAGTVILIVVAVMWWMTTSFDSDPLGMAQGMPATHMPRLILGVIAGLTILIMAQAVLSGGEALGDLPPWQVVATVALMASAAFLFPVIGVPLTFLGVCAMLPILWGRRNYMGIAGFSVGMPVAIYIVFKLLLGLRLPMGPLSAVGL